MTEPINLQDRIHSRRTLATPALLAEDDPEACEDWGCFSTLRGLKERSLMLDFRFKTGQREAFAYALLERVSYDPSEGLLLRFLGTLVKLTGRNLLQPSGKNVQLVEALLRHRVSWIAELDEVQSWTKTSDLPIITGIEIVGVK
ncbi:MAG: hypothetical protein ACRC8S_13625 [Fimbriiglobus sp.]